MIPTVNGMLTRMTLRTPTIDGSVADLTAKFMKETTWQRSEQRYETPLGGFNLSSTGAAKAEVTVIPAVKGMLTGTALRTPTIDVSAAGLTVKFKKETTWQRSAQKGNAAQRMT